ncbi:hypothetical protein CAP36_09695 [Chitinophagaceae bacterium IBVUCB2]|nr:hypothetical protein CAP36_09695 [Chitinophagaceae bacterium IBVUCB2]
MKRPSSIENLEIRIKQLERQYEEQVADIKLSASGLVESVSPMQILKSTLRTVVNTPGLKGNLVDTAVGLGAGFLGKKLLVNKSGGIFRKLTGSALQLILTNFVSKKLNQVRDDNSQA